MLFRLILASIFILTAGACASSAAAPTVMRTEAPTLAPLPTAQGTLLSTQEVDMMLQISTPAFDQGGSIPARFTCTGENISPALQWGEPPTGTQSFALIMDDPDAPMGVFVHWVIFNIPASSRGLPEALEAGARLADGTQQGLGSSRKHGYMGPCPPSGTHRYFFKLYALDSMLSLSSDASAGDLMKALSGHILVNAELVGTFSK